MKKQVISVALFAVLATMAVSCQKENFVEPQSAVAEVGTVRTVSYAVDGVAHQVTLHGDAEWDAFVDSMMSLSEQGYDVRIINENAASQSPPRDERRANNHYHRPQRGESMGKTKIG